MEFLFKLGLYGIYVIVVLFIFLVLYVIRINRKLGSVIIELDKIAPEPSRTKIQKKKKGFKQSKLYKNYLKLNSAIKKSGFERYLQEYFISANIVTVLGSIILLVGVGFFIRYSILDAWINIYGRIVLAILTSVSLLLLAHILHKKQKAFSSIITGTALGILYYIFASAYYNYQLFSTGEALFITISLTIFSVLLSFFYNRVSLAQLAVLAAYTAPMLIDYNRQEVLLLFYYLLVLDIGVFMIVFFKYNLFLNLQAFAFTIVYFGTWLVHSIRYQDYTHYHAAFFFLIVFYILLFFIIVTNKLRFAKKFIPLEISGTITLNMLVFTAGVFLLDVLNPEYKGLFTALIALINISFFYGLMHLKKIHNAITFLELGVSVVFLSLIAPVEFVGKSLTIVWAIQLVLLLWISQKVDFKVFRFGSAFMAFLIISLSFNQLYETFLYISPRAEFKPILLNLDFISGLMSSLGLIACIYLVSKEKDEYYIKPLKISVYQAILSVFSLLIFYFNLYVEIDYHVTINIESEIARKIILGIYNFSFILAAGIAFTKIKNYRLKQIGAIFINLALIIYFTYYFLIIIQARDELISGSGISSAQFWMHLVISGLIISLSYINYLLYKDLLKANQIFKQFTLWPLMLILLVIISFEFDQVWLIFYNKNNMISSDVLEFVHRTPYTLLWALYAALLTLAGTLLNNIQLRQISLFVIFVAMFKLFFKDFQYMDIPNRTISLISMGGILLFIAFVYQFNRKKIQTDE